MATIHFKVFPEGCFEIGYKMF